MDGRLLQGVVHQQLAHHLFETDRGGEMNVAGCRALDKAWQTRGGHLLDLPLQIPKHRDGPTAVRRQPGASPLVTTDRRFDKHLARGLVDALHEQPGSAVGHTHVTSRGADTAPTVDPFEQLQTSPAEDGATGTLNPDANAHGPIAVPRWMIKRHGLKLRFSDPDKTRMHHLAVRWRGADLIGRTPIDRMTVAVLNISNPVRAELRQRLIDARLFPPG